MLEELLIIINDWLKQDDGMDYMLVIKSKNDKFFTSYAKEDYLYLLETYNIDGNISHERFPLESVIEHEIQDGEVGFIYKKDNGKVEMIATYNKFYK